MKKLLTVVGCLISIAIFAQQSYWQQRVDYTIDVALNDKDHSLKGHLELEYTNNSPDKLHFIWFHLWPNAYKNESTAFAKQLFREAEGKKRWKKIKDKGYIDSLDFTVNGQKVKTETDPENIDIVKLLLPAPLNPGEKIKITTPFFVKLATYNSRSGHDGKSYMVCQWYPKPAVYDRKGWHPMPYLDQGEFYSEFGSFTVNITLPSAYILGATGALQNEEELNQYKKIGSENVAAKSLKNKTAYQSNGASKTLTYKADSVHDFAWFANKDFVIRYDTLQANNKTVDVFTYHHPDGNKNWVNSINYVESAVQSYSSWIGEYFYPVVQAVEGPKNDMSGGMEYPMITLITSPAANEEMLDAVITHEVGHNWLYGMLASNERIHAWLDEGINTYFQFRYEAEKYKANSVFGASLPYEVKQKSTDDFQAAVYNALNQIPMQEIIDVPSGNFKNKEEYGLITYLKTAVWLYVVELHMGKENLEKGIKAYFDEWKFKHPYPEDLKAVLERESGKDMTPYFDLLKKKGGL
jgi:hypothetical protein